MYLLELIRSVQIKSVYKSIYISLHTLDNKLFNI